MIFIKTGMHLGLCGGINSIFVCMYFNFALWIITFESNNTKLLGLSWWYTK